MAMQEAGFDSAGETEQPQLPRAAAEIQADIDKLIGKHRSEIQRAIRNWLQSQEDRPPPHNPRSSADAVVTISEACCGSSSGTQELESPSPAPARDGSRAWSKPQEYAARGAEQRSAHPTHTVSQAWIQPQESLQGKAGDAVVDRGTSGRSVVSNTSVVPGSTSTKTLTSRRPSVASAIKNEIVDALAKKAGKRSAVKPGEYITSRQRELAAAQLTRLQRLTSSRAFEFATGLLICSNAIFLGLLTQHTADRTQAKAMGPDASRGNRMVNAELPLGFVVMQVLFTFAFTADLGLRWAADGLLEFFRTPDVGWNIFDIVVVSTSFLDVLAVAAPNLVGRKGMFGGTTALRVMRVMRIVRIARVIRILPFFRELRMMVFALLNSAKSLLWVFIILGLLFFIIGISLTSGTMEYLRDTSSWRDAANQDLIAAFGSLDKSVLSLYMAMSGGNDWAYYYDLLKPLPAQQKFVFLAFISFSNFAVVNIVTGIFVDCAMQSNQNDKEVMVQDELVQKEKYLKDMRVVFEEIDDDKTGTIDMHEFKEKMDDERVLAYFHALKMNVEDIYKLFRLLDMDQSGSINIDEFISGCHRLKGESRALDMAIMHFEMQWLTESMVSFQSRVDSSLKLIEGKL